MTKLNIDINQLKTVLSEEKLIELLANLVNELQNHLDIIQNYSGMSEDKSPLHKIFGEPSGYDKLVESLHNHIDRQDKWLKRKNELITNMQKSIEVLKADKKEYQKKYLNLKKRNENNAN